MYIGSKIQCIKSEASKGMSFHATSSYIIHIRITHRKDFLRTYHVSSHKLQPGKAPRKLVYILFIIGNTNDNHCPYNRIHKYRFMFVVVVNSPVNKWQFHMI